MKMPWHNKTGLAKAAIICATGLGISTGLCGLNLLLSTHPPGGYPNGLLLLTAFIEAGAMVIFAFWLLLVALAAIGTGIAKLFRKPEKPE